MFHFTADTHFGHGNLITKLGRKGFASIEEHDAFVIDKFNTLVGRNDWLVHLGDFSWPNANQYRRRLKMNILFVIGNHDKRQHCMDTFGDIPDKRMIHLSNKRDAFCTHYPNAYWDKSHHGSYHLYGHMHAQREDTLDAIWPERRSMDVGIDNAIRLLGEARPFSERDIIRILEPRKGHDPVEYYESLRKAPVSDENVS